ncbi:MAG: hypothetical protein IPN29_17970 [Saprospiraceae bacterium]|nr:hypothetical protein [Saprospiraceae bacterium]
MKKFLSFLLLASITVAAYGQDITEKQFSLISKRTADWCPYCGTYGWQFTSQLKQKLQGKDAIMWNVHHSGGLATNTSKAIGVNLGGSAQPLFFLNTESDDLGVTASNVTEKVNEVAALIDDLSFFGAIVGMGAEATVKEDTLKASARIEFYDSAESGEFYIGFYLVKKNLVAFQQSVGQNAVHHSVLDQSLTPGHFGIKVGAAPVANGAIFAANAKLDQLVLHNGNLNDTKVVVVLWNKIPSGKYIFLNAREVNIIEDQTSAVQDENAGGFDFKAVAGQQSIDIFTADELDPETPVALVDLKGNSIPFGMERLGNRHLRLQGVFIPSGIYFVSIGSDRNKKTRQIVFLD